MSLAHSTVDCSDDARAGEWYQYTYTIGRGILATDGLNAQMLDLLSASSEITDLYTIYRIINDELYLGEATTPNDGSTDALRHDTVNSQPLIKQ